MARADREPTGGDHQRPYPELLFGHVLRAVEAHVALTVPPDRDDTDGDTEEGGSNGV